MEAENRRITREFFLDDVLTLAPQLPGKIFNIAMPGGKISGFMITEVEAYRGSEDEACHASKGMTKRNEVMFGEGGHLYVYLIYGMYWMLNIVTGPADSPQAALIRGVTGFPGPGRLTKGLGIDKSFNGEDLVSSDRIWLVSNGFNPVLKTGPRIGIGYAGEYWRNIHWRFFIST